MVLSRAYRYGTDRTNRYLNLSRSVDPCVNNPIIFGRYYSYIRINRYQVMNFKKMVTVLI